MLSQPPPTFVCLTERQAQTCCGDEPALQEKASWCVQGVRLLSAMRVCTRELLAPQTSLYPEHVLYYTVLCVVFGIDLSFYDV